ncbi:MAG: hypothetical protein B9S32_02865 [Verrucomicrobia bacterium Tous-C9LFEB]|nr:MAG: hypothetical protein B9S32_02865 [Verrucomicrobia bacterium Tous-C9LFEB]
MNSLRLRLIVLLGLLGTALPLVAASRVEWPLGGRLTLEITEFGGIGRLSDAGKVIVGNSQIFLHKVGKEGVIYQGAGFVAGGAADIKRTDTEVVATGSLLKEKSADAPKVADYVVTYKKVTDGVVQVRVEVTYLADSSWSIPAQFSLSFPFADYAGAQLVTLDHESTERTYEFGSAPVKFTGYGFKSGILTKGSQSVTIEPMGDTTAINFQDSRGWGGDYLRVDLMARQEWKTPFTFKAGTKQSFEAKISIKSGH